MATPRASKDVQFKTHWRPFFLMRPEVWNKGVASGEFPEDAQTKGIVKLNYYISKFGANRLPPMLERLEGAMTASGIDGFSMGGNTGPTLDGHRLATYAEKEGLEKQNAFMEEIFKAGPRRHHDSLITSAHQIQAAFTCLFPISKHACIIPHTVRPYVG